MLLPIKCESCDHVFFITNTNDYDNIKIINENSLEVLDDSKTSKCPKCGNLSKLKKGIYTQKEDDEIINENTNENFKINEKYKKMLEDDLNTSDSSSSNDKEKMSLSDIIKGVLAIAPLLAGAIGAFNNVFDTPANKEDANSQKIQKQSEKLNQIYEQNKLIIKQEELIERNIELLDDKIDLNKEKIEINNERGNNQ